MDKDKISQFFSKENLRNTVATSMFASSVFLTPTTQAQENHHSHDHKNTPQTEFVEKHHHDDHRHGDTKKPSAKAITKAQKEYNSTDESITNDINVYFLEQADENADKIMQDVQTSYFQKNMDRISKLNDDLKHVHGEDHPDIVLIDPTQYEAISNILKVGGSWGLETLAHNQTDTQQNGFVMMGAAQAFQMKESAYVTETLNVSPKFIAGSRGGNKDALSKLSPVLMTSSIAHADDLIPEFDKVTEMEYINLHETYHAYDDYERYSMIPDDTAASVRGHLPQTVLDDPYGSLYIEQMNRFECFADVGAVGDMIRLGGKDLSIIDATKKFRDQADKVHVTHQTGYVLGAFKQEIEEMGIDNFKKLSDQEARQFYKDVVEEHALNKDHIETYMKYSLALNNPENIDNQKIIQDIESTKETDPHVQKALSFNEPVTQKSVAEYNQSVREKLNQPRAITDAEKYAIEQTKDWDPEKALFDRAFEKGEGIITPTSVAHAYASLHNDYYEGMKNDPANEEIYAAKLQKVQSYVIHSDIDYAKTNADYGVGPKQLNKVITQEKEAAQEAMIREIKSSTDTLKM